MIIMLLVKILLSMLSVHQTPAPAPAPAPVPVHVAAPVTPAPTPAPVELPPRPPLPTPAPVAPVAPVELPTPAPVELPAPVAPVEQPAPVELPTLPTCADGEALAEDGTCVPVTYWDEPAHDCTPLLVDESSAVTWEESQRLQAEGWTGHADDSQEALYPPGC
jgi:outer membrane biosynthesis protein TonB